MAHITPDHSFSPGARHPRRMSLAVSISVSDLSSSSASPLHVARSVRAQTAGLSDRTMVQGMQLFDESEDAAALKLATADIASDSHYSSVDQNQELENPFPRNNPQVRTHKSTLSTILDKLPAQVPVSPVEPASVPSLPDDVPIYLSPETVSENMSLLAGRGVYDGFDCDPEAGLESQEYVLGHTISPSYGTVLGDSSNQGFHQNHESSYKQNMSRMLKSWRNIDRDTLMLPIKSIPSVLVGTLLNVLDGLSYGMILFPLGTYPFTHLDMAGLSMFYISCIVSQLVYSLGGSMFKAGTGGEMIEVVPFFHSMALTILAEIGENRPESVVATTILSFALSSIVTGLVFYLLGYARLGSLVSFFPRHILVGCVGGVGYFLVVTGIEVSSRLGAVEYTIDYMSALFSAGVVLKWLSPLVLALVLMALEKSLHHPLVLPSYFVGLFAIFHVIVALVPGLSLQDLRDSGWLFQPPASREPWYAFYSLYKFSEVDWLALLRTVPAMFALTFFGILHVPINVPALAASLGEDTVDVDRELRSHGWSNALSGLCGSVQNYLVYTNSLLFIKSGADSRVAGVMLAFATFGVMAVGPSIIGFIPVMVVGALIFLLGIELMSEALIDTWSCLNRFDYLTVAAIVVAMGVWDFVYGIVLGIVLACACFVIEASQTNPIRATYTGTVARSTVRRHPLQQQFLSQVGRQIVVLKLTGTIFFGTIVKVETLVRNLLVSDSDPIRYLIFDLSAVTELDFSAAEAFARMSRLLSSKQVFMLLSDSTDNAKVVNGLKAIKLWDDNNDVSLFENLNLALEWCENEFLSHYHLHHSRLTSGIGPVSQQEAPPKSMAVKPRLSPRFMDFVPSSLSFGSDSAAPANPDLPSPADPAFNKSLGIDIEAANTAPFAFVGTPRASTLQQAAETVAREDVKSYSKWRHFRQPLPVMMQIFGPVSDKDEGFWNRVAPYFKRQALSSGTVLYHRGQEATGFYLVESGMLRADYNMEQGRFYESILAGTTCGELPFFSNSTRTATVTAERDSVVWQLDQAAYRQICEDGLDMANELLTVALRLTVERFTSVTAYVLISS